MVFEELKSSTSFDHAKIEDQRGPSGEAAARAELTFRGRRAPVGVARDEGLRSSFATLIPVILPEVLHIAPREVGGRREARRAEHRRGTCREVSRIAARGQVIRIAG